MIIAHFYALIVYDLPVFSERARRGEDVYGGII